MKTRWLCLAVVAVKQYGQADDDGGGEKEEEEEEDRIQITPGTAPLGKRRVSSYGIESVTKLSYNTCGNSTFCSCSLCNILTALSFLFPSLL